MTDKADLIWTGITSLQWVFPESLDGDIEFRKEFTETLVLLSLEANFAADGKCPQVFTVGGFLRETVWRYVIIPVPNLDHVKRRDALGKPVAFFFAAFAAKKAKLHA